MDNDEGASVLVCCGAEAHPWDKFCVSAEWLPKPLRYLVIGESPGGARSGYFYEPRRKVRVRTIILRELHRHRLIDKPSLAAFRDAGFLFDHAIRCLLPSKVIQREANLADRYESPRAADATHLASFLRQGSPVWAMGRIARNAVAVLCCDFPRDRSKISKPPYPRRLPDASRFFVSRYLLHASGAEVAKIFARIHSFIDDTSTAQCAACRKTI